MSNVRVLLGQKYKDRKDRVWHVVKHDPGFRYPWLATNLKTGSVQSFTDMGRWSQWTSTEYDLVEVSRV